MKREKNTFLYYIYILLLIIILWSAYQIQKYYREKGRTVSEKTTEYFNDTLTVFVYELPVEFNPYQVIYDEDVFLLNQIYRGLVRINSNLIEAPDLAEYWDISKDKKTYTFYLQDDIYFHDNTPIKTADFIESIHYFFKNYSQNYSLDYFSVIDGIEEYISGKSERISGIKKISDKEFSITLKKPYIPFLKLLTLPQMKILPAHYLNSNFKQLIKIPVGNGPYKVDLKSENMLLLRSFKKNRIFDPKVEYFKILGTSLSDSRSPHYNKFRSQDFDITFLYEKEFMENPHNMKYRTSSSLNLVFIGFNCSLPPTDNVWMRRIIFYSIDAETFLEDTIDSNTIPAEFVSPILLPQEQYQRPIVSYNPDKASDIFTNKIAGNDTLLHSDIIFAFDSVTFSDKYMDIFDSFSDSYEVKINLRKVAQENLSGPINMFDSANIFIYDWVMDLPDPEFFFRLLFKSDSPMNIFHYSNPEVDSLLELARYEETIPERLNFFSKIENIIFNDIPLRPFLYVNEYIFFKDYVEGAFLSRMGLSSLELDKITVSPNYLSKTIGNTDE